MCGLIFVRRAGSNASKMAAKRYQFQKKRGSQGFGYIAINDGKMVSLKRSEEEKDILDLLKTEVSEEILLHHRMPTSTPNVSEATHPIVVQNALLNFDYYVIHNGIIYNDETLKEEHEKIGFKYTTEMQEQIVTSGKSYNYEKKWNDSEAFAIELALTIEGLNSTIKARGSIAFIALQVEKKTNMVANLYYGRNLLNPLLVNENKEFLTILSEGGGTSVEPNKLFRLDYKENKIYQRPMSIGIEPREYKSDYFPRKETVDVPPRNASTLAEMGFELPPARGTHGMDDEIDENMEYLEYKVQSLEDEKMEVNEEWLLALEEGNLEAEIEARTRLVEIISELSSLQISGS